LRYNPGPQAGNQPARPPHHQSRRSL
jgi:hypothetical protein